MKRTDNRKKHKSINLPKKWILIGIGLWILSFFIDLIPIFFVTLFTVGNTLMQSFKRYVDPPIDIELSTFSSILITIEYGLGYGLMAAFFTKFVQMLYIRKIKMAYFFMISSYMVAALFANFFSALNIVTMGIIVTIISNFYLAFIRKFLLGYAPVEILSYAVTNIIFNIVLFIGFSELFLIIMI